MAGDAPLVALPPSFIACAGRSGSTLLRWLIDAHPEIGCPGETDLAVLLSGYVRAASDLSGRAQGLPAPTARARRMGEELFSTYLEAVGKERWCDKSLSNVFHLELLSSVWPEARFILLYRHCMDLVMNGIEASPWGLSEYGFAQVAQMSPTDSVVALAAYWVDRTTRMIAFERRFPDRCLRVRYEDLVTSTEEVLGGIWDFLGVEAVAGISSAAFEMEHSTFGPADHEIWFTNGIHRASIGQGARVPPDHVSGPLRESVNALLGQLDYELVDDGWGSGRGALTSGISARPDAAAPTGEALAELRIVQGHEILWCATIDLISGALAERAPLSDPATGEGAPAGSFVVVVERNALAAICEGAEHIGTALRSRSVRYYGPLAQQLKDEREIFERVAATLIANGSELLDQSAAAIA